MDVRIEPDTHLERRNRPDAGRQFRGVQVAVRSRNIGPADLPGGIAAQGNDVADAGVPVILDRKSVV